MVSPGSDFQTYKKLCSSSNKINSLGKPSNRWKDIYVNKAVLGDGDADSDVRLVADITGTETNPELKYNVTEQRWQVSHDGLEFNTLRNIYSGSELPNNEIGVNGDLWFVYSEAPDTPCSGPWKWFKFSFIPQGLDYGDYIRFFANVEWINVSMGFPNDPEDLLANNDVGTAYVSSSDAESDASNMYDGYGWISDSQYINTPEEVTEEWFAFKFNTPRSFDNLALFMRLYKEDMDDGRYAYRGGNLYVSNDSTNGMDGTWELHREGIFDEISLTYYSAYVAINVPLCSDAPIDYEELVE
jgi:hypothetical protein